jgi:EpsI family protein
MQLGAWVATPKRIDEVSLRMLKLSDYLLLDLQRTERGSASTPATLELYVAWNDSQRQSLTTHSPRSCLPGGGWNIVDMRPFVVPNIGTVRRMLIVKGDERRIVYYWFHERGAVITNEFLVKWRIFVDSLVRNRTDGALIRITVPLERSDREAAIDAGVRVFLRELQPRLKPYLAD